MREQTVIGVERALRVGVVGVGIMGSNHARVFADCRRRSLSVSPILMRARGVHVMVEKPIASTVAKGREIIDAVPA